MLPVLLLGVKRPGLARLLAERGLAARGAAAGAVAALVAEGLPRPACPAVVQASAGPVAGALLDGGADDVVLPTDPDSLVAARIAALVRRARPELIQVGDIVIDTVERRVTRAGQPIKLLPREYLLLLHLARHANAVVDHGSLHQALWGRAFDPGTNVIAVHVSRVRAKLGAGSVTVRTERGRGYRLVTSIADTAAAG